MKNKSKPILIFGVIILFSFSLSGQTWSARQRLTWNTGNSSSPRMAVSSGTGIHILWSDYTFYKSEILYKNSTDRGDTWQPPTRLTWNPNYSKQCDAAGFYNYVFIVWSDYFSYNNYEIMHKRANVLTSTWDASKRVTWRHGTSSKPSICISFKADIGATYTLVHIVWVDETTGNEEIYYKKGTYQKDKISESFYWSELKRLTWNSSSSRRPVVAVDSNQIIHVIWYDNSSGNTEIYHKRSTDEGVTWSALHRLTWTSDPSFELDMTIDSADRIHIVWYDGPYSSSSLFHKKSTNGGLNWTGPTRIMWTSPSAAGTSIAADSSNNLHVLYTDNHTGTDEIYYKKSTNGGLNWSAPKQLTWNSPGQNFNPNIIVDNSGGLHAAWDGPVFFSELPGYTHEIFYKNKK